MRCKIAAERIEMVGDFFKFDFLITPYVIGFVYFFGAVIIPFVILSIAKKKSIKIDNTKLRLYILIAFLMCELCWRIFCEFFMVYFKLLDTIK
jgi:hypothetical protein